MDPCMAMNAHNVGMEDQNRSLEGLYTGVRRFACRL
jgi:hypothetical protein